MGDVPGELGRPPDHSVLRDNRLVAYVWAVAAGGVLRRAAGAARGEPVCEVPFAEVRFFDPRVEDTLTGLVSASKNLDAFLFKLGIEGFEVTAGAAEPSALIRRF